MATISFFRPLVIRTDEEARILIELVEQADCNKDDFVRLDTSKMLESGREFLRERYSGSKK